ncbi:MAG: CheR family methyltransferase [Longimicrobiaceae bacterium]
MNGDATLPAPNLALEGDDEGFEALKEKIFRERGFNCRFYKNKCLRRRVAVRMRAKGQSGFGQYAGLLDRDPVEYDLLLDALTINVSKFFRNRESWEVVRERVVPALFDRPEARVRVWSAGAASGEEAYTLSIILREWAEVNSRQEELARFRILGTDIDLRSLDAARRAEYTDLAMMETPAGQQERWFSPGPPFRLREEARRNVAFVRKDLISGEPERDQAMILCRNVIIYFSREIQERLFRRFYDCLLPGGFLVLGKVETLFGEVRSRFSPVDNRERVFQKPEAT